MKVGLFIEKFDAARGGRERSIAEIASLLASRGADVTVVCKSGSCDNAAVKVLRTGGPKLCKIASAFDFNRRCRKIVSSGSFDITHSVFPLLGCDIYQLRNGVIPAVRDAHMALSGAVKRLTWPMNLSRLYHWRQERLVMRDKSVLCLPVSEKVAADIKRYYNRSENVRTVFNGIYLPGNFDAERAANRQKWRSRWQADENTTVFLSLANNHKLKGVSQLVKTFAELNSASGKLQGSAKLVIVGSGKPPADIPENVIFEKSVKNAFELYAAADICVLLSWYDACSRVVLEAYSVGLPCVTTKSNGAAEILDSGSGIVIDSPESSEQLEAAMVALGDPAQRSRMNTPDVDDRYKKVSMERHVDQLLEIYNKLAEEKR